MSRNNILESIRSQSINEKELYEAYKIFFGTLVSDSRLRILNLLRSGKKNVSEIYEAIGKEQTSTSHDLARLRQCGFVKVDVKGKFRYYSLNEKTIEPIMILIDKHMAGNCIHILHKQKMKGHAHEH